MKTQNASDIFRDALDKLYESHLPSKHPFFKHLAAFPTEKFHSPALLGELYRRYQAAMHATRVMVYHLPYLDNISLRSRKLKILIDDDGLQGGDTHHSQLSCAFAHIGAELGMEDDQFGNLDELKKSLDPMTSNFVSLVQELYPKSLGAWCIVEMLSNDWMIALMRGLAVHFPSIKNEPYFAECFAQGIEDQHAQESLALTSIVLAHSPELLEQTIEGARTMAVALDNFWSGLENLLTESGDRTLQQGCISKT